MKLHNLQMDMSKLLLVGHSVGAHLCGMAGRYFYRQTGKKLPRISGLDPSRFCFYKRNGLAGLRSGDAAFVDVTHTSLFGVSEPVGDADFYPNPGNVFQPGTTSPVDSHISGCVYYMESSFRGNELSFMATKCASESKYLRGECDDEIKTPMGYAADPKVHGTFFLKTNSQSPFGQLPIPACTYPDFH